MISYDFLFCHGYEDRGAKSVGVLAIDLMAQMPPITNSLARNALQFTDDVTIYTNGSQSVASALLPMVEKKGIKVDDKPIKRLIKEPNAAEVTIDFQDRSSITHSFLVHGPRNEMPLDFAKSLNLERMPSGGELKVVNMFQETTEPGCYAVGDIGSMGKIVVAGVAYGTFAATGIVRQLQME
jgi:gliotoxin/aspirochlorine biosynthesis thioredoxin reductase